jgi:hypothetical protein
MEPLVTTAPALVRLSLLVALIAAGAGLCWPGSDGSIELTSLRGEAVELYGRDIYQHDTQFVGSLNRGPSAGAGDRMGSTPTTGVMEGVR